MVIRPDRRLALLAVAKCAGIGAAVGLVVGIGMTIDDAGPGWPVLWVPPMLAVLGGGTCGVLLALTWWACAGQVTYSVVDGLLTARRGRWVRTTVPIERIADVGFDRHVRWTHLVFTHWLTHEAPIPALVVTWTRTSDRWDPTNDAVVDLPRILLSGARQDAALRQLRAALGLGSTTANAPNG